MKELILKYGFIHYQTGCSCIGSPRYYQNDKSGYRVILKNGTATIRKDGVEKFKTKDITELENKLIEYEIKAEN